MGSDGSPALLSCEVFRASDIVVVSGANLGDGMDSHEAACPGDVYQLSRRALPTALMLDPGTARRGGDMRLAGPADPGHAGEPVHLVRRLVTMTADGDTVELLILEHRSEGGQTRASYVLPLSPMLPKTDYTLVRLDDDPGDVRLSDVLFASFLAGTMISLADGRQVPIESLQPGDRVLTRDHGAQPLRWLGRATLRAQGGFAPVVIASGTFGNDGDLIVSQHHRLFLYQRVQGLAESGPELLVQARHLVDGDRIALRPGSIVDYYSLAFDHHEIIYAQGIPAESLMVSEATMARLPEALATDLRAQMPELSQAQHYGTEITRRLIERIGRQALIVQQRRIGENATGEGER